MGPQMEKKVNPILFSLKWNAKVDQCVAEERAGLSALLARTGTSSHQSWPLSENHSRVDTGTEVRRSETKLQSFSILHTV